MRQELRQFVTENFLFGSNSFFADGDSFIEKGIIDSTGVLELVVYLQTRYGISIRDEELIPENLDSINNIIHFVESSQREQQMSSLHAS